MKSVCAGTEHLVLEFHSGESSPLVSSELQHQTGLFPVLKSPGYCGYLLFKKLDAQLIPPSISFPPPVPAQGAESNLSGLKCVWEILS